jgi:D-alanyl-D-alanine carboxypeptidase
MRNGVLLYNPALEWTGGGLAASSADLVRWARALYTGRALPLPYLHELFASVPAGSAHERYGLGVDIEGVGAGTSYGHTGSIPGYRSVMRYFPNSDITVAVQVNDDLEEGSGADAVFVEAALESLRLRSLLRSAASSTRCSTSD